MSYPRRISAIAAAAAIALSALSLAACTADPSPGEETDPTDAAGRSPMLTVGSQYPVMSLNPVLTPVSNVVTFAYDPVIFKANDGSYLPDLATEWGYVGDGNTVFEFTLRDGVTFQQGGELDADAAVASLEYFLATPNSNGRSVGAIDSVEAVDERTVRITYAAPFPNAVESLTQFYGMGLLIGPDGLADPDGLEAESDGAGQYALNPDETVSGSTVAFTANEDYFAPDAIRFDEVTISILTDANARLSALKSGQIDIAQQIPVAQVGQSALEGLQTLTGYTNWKSIQFLDTSSGPLASADVRRAINLAIDRETLVSAFYSGQAKVQEQTTPEGQVGFDESLVGSTPFDLDEAKSLLASAGYADGFELDLLTSTISDQGGLLGQVLVDQLAAAGITVNLTVANGTFEELMGALSGGEHDAVVYGLFANDLYTMVTQSIVTPGTLLNPNGAADTTAEGLIADAAQAADADVFAQTLRDLNAHLNDVSFGVPLVTESSTDIVSDAIVLPSTSYTIPQPNVVAPDPALAISKTS